MYWQCECGDRREVCGEHARSSCDSWYADGDSGGCEDATGSCVSGSLGPPEGPGGSWTCPQNYYISGQDYQCTGGSSPCCESGSKCDGSTLKTYSRCRLDSSIECEHGCEDASCRRAPGDTR